MRGPAANIASASQGAMALAGRWVAGRIWIRFFIEFSFDFYVIDVRFLEGKWFGV
ncbi:hypothetical protein J2A69_04450 [Burkholderia pseudomallei]|uniref:hypothetical protein n=1 Tax=Burkholderia pseudomallei TaxID=28450 RepID=UPI001A978E1C|nr:hypothetical protein [Burkholderia pseudomallei]MBO2952927.1 hypothetical protein [Burkholderia pseudomallei]QSY07800.1 hypothetical protein J1906_04450 [Burkholderia pseudomallei]QSY15584.1 hypothetical protein J2A69_04450 [Burkholderia pseudomallei]QTB62699.1 hypothetical protein J3D99_02125 [Burkholderia pseudomallei]